MRDTDRPAGILVLMLIACPGHSRACQRCCSVLPSKCPVSRAR
jgi:hypothetical protein